MNLYDKLSTEDKQLIKDYICKYSRIDNIPNLENTLQEWSKNKKLYIVLWAISLGLLFLSKPLRTNKNCFVGSKINIRFLLFMITFMLKLLYKKESTYLYFSIDGTFS